MMRPLMRGDRQNAANGINHLLFDPLSAGVGAGPPKRQAIERLPSIAKLIDGCLREARAERLLLQAACKGAKPLDWEAIETTEAVYRGVLRSLPVYDHQLACWRQAKCSYEQRREIERLQEQIWRLRSLISDLLRLCSRICHKRGRRDGRWPHADLRRAAVPAR
jgi:hypothetical protein